MENRGFTLIELLGVIVILSIVAVITTPIVLNVISDVKNDLNNEQIKYVENAARNWGVKNLSLTIDNVPSKTFIKISELQSLGYLENKTLKNLNLSSSELANAGVCIIYDNQYIYNFAKSESECS